MQGKIFFLILILFNNKKLAKNKNKYKILLLILFMNLNLQLMNNKQDIMKNSLQKYLILKRKNMPFNEIF